MTAPDDGYVAFDSPALEAERKVLEARPEQQAATAINAMVVDAGAFGTVPGGTAAAGRVQSWVQRTRTEMDRVGAEVADLQVCTRKARELSDRAAADTIAAARTGTPG